MDFEKQKYLGNLEQLAFATRMQVSEGKADGLRVIDVDNGNGLSARFLESRCLDIGKLSFRGNNIGFLSKAGFTGAWVLSVLPGEMKRYFNGGMLATCGLSNFGPNQEIDGEHVPMHGRIGMTPATDVIAKVDYDQNKILISGTMIQSAVFGQNLHMERKIEILLDSNKISITDKITNNNYDDEMISLLYHINFGYPMLSEHTKLRIEGTRPEPRDENAEKGVDRWDNFEKPTDNRPEECFYHSPQTNEQGVASVKVANKELGVQASIMYKTACLPQLIQWKSMASGDYALGIEPATSRLSGRVGEMQAGRLVKIESKAYKEFGFELMLESI